MFLREKAFCLLKNAPVQGTFTRYTLTATHPSTSKNKARHRTFLLEGMDHTGLLFRHRALTSTSVGLPLPGTLEMRAGSISRSIGRWMYAFPFVSDK